MVFTQLFPGDKIREAIFMYRELKSFRKVQKILRIGKSTIQRWYNQFNKFTSSHKNISRKSRILKFPELKNDINNVFHHEELKYSSLHKVQKALGYEKKPSISTIRLALKKGRLSRRRFAKLSRHECNKKSEEFLTRECDFQDNFKHSNLDEIVCIDETGFSSIGNACYGYFPMGKQPKYKRFEKRFRKSVCMAITPNQIVNVESQDTPYNGSSFYDFIENTILNLITNGNVPKYFLMDNVSFHRSKRVQELLDLNNIKTLFIPPYSPQYNPIEQVFSRLKREYKENIMIREKNFEDSIKDSITFLITKESTFRNNYMSTLKECKGT